MDREGVGGFLESILAVMVVITASSVFLVVLASGTLQVEEEIDQAELISWLTANGLFSEETAIGLDASAERLGGPELPEGIRGMSIAYRLSGDPAPLLELNLGEGSQGDVLAFKRPMLIEVGGRDVPGVMEVRAWH
ncbi:MAG TPA: hypothetical protein PLR51_00865 [Methanomassiliicoccales archaeon]|nr:hypothetical protein [Methanomassiliicoccales archaeon]